MKKYYSCVFAILCFLFFVLPAAASGTMEDRIAAVEKQLSANWKFYGMVSMLTFYENYDAQDTRGPGHIDDKGTKWGLNTITLIGATVSLGDIEGHFEYGHVDDVLIYTRLLYGTWNFGAGKILVGQDYTPLYWTINNKVYMDDSNMFGFGQFYGGREAQIKLLYGDFQVALINPSAGISATTDAFSNSLGMNVDSDVFIPRIELSYDINLDSLRGRVIGGYKTFKAITNKGMVAERSENIDAWIAALAMKYSVGPFSVGVTGFYAGNIASYSGDGAGGVVAMNIRKHGNVANGGLGGHISGMPEINSLTGEIDDCTTWGAHIAAGYKINDMISAEIGYGYQQDKWDTSGKLIAQSYYLNMPINIAKGFSITPEFGIETYKIKSGGDSTKIGKNTYFGANWRILF